MNEMKGQVTNMNNSESVIVPQVTFINIFIKLDLATIRYCRDLIFFAGVVTCFQPTVVCVITKKPKFVQRGEDQNFCFQIGIIKPRNRLVLSRCTPRTSVSS